MAAHSDTWTSFHDLVLEVAIRFCLGIVFIYLEFLEPFHRNINNEEIWLYRNPKTESYIPNSLLWPIVFLAPLLVFLIFYIIRKDRIDSIQAVLSLSLSLGLNGVLTNLIKLVVGRPRPDYFWRCFPDGIHQPNMVCTGNEREINEGLKSFPSGHSSFAFCGLGFASLYITGKLQTFTSRGRGRSWRLLFSLGPLIGALIIALSRTCDYHHHWQDVLVGSILGFLLAWLCYRQYYPSLVHPNSNVPYVVLKDLVSVSSSEDLKHLSNLQEVSVKWI